MKEHPILFSAPMIRAILNSSKTQTRRVVKPQPERGASGTLMWGASHRGMRVGVEGLDVPPGVLARCPYGVPGDRLWVRETTINVEEHGYEGPVYAESDVGEIALSWGLAPDPDDMAEVEPYEVRKRPSIHMPRRYARIFLEVTGVRVERLQEITVSDAICEGYDGSITDPIDPSIRWYSALWEQINGPASWEANPWVWVISFRRIEGAA